MNDPRLIQSNCPEDQDELIPLAKVPDMLVGANALSTIYSWASGRAFGGLQMHTYRVGNRYYTTVNLIREFLDEVDARIEKQQKGAK